MMGIKLYLTVCILQTAHIASDHSFSKLSGKFADISNVRHDIVNDLSKHFSDVGNAQTLDAAYPWSIRPCQSLRQ